MDALEPPMLPEERLEAARDYVLHDVVMALQDFAGVAVCGSTRTDIQVKVRDTLARLARRHKGGDIGVVAQAILDSHADIQVNHRTGRLHADLSLSIAGLSQPLDDLQLRKCKECGVGYHAQSKSRSPYCPRCLADLL